MKLKVFVISALLILAGTGIVLSEDMPAPQESASNSASVPKPSNDLNTQWAWGEVVSVDAQNKTITIKYLDYELDQEKELSLAVENSTTYENIKTFEEIQPKDNLSIDYITVDGKNIAKSISLEKPEAALPVSNKAKPVLTTPTSPVPEEKESTSVGVATTQAQAPTSSGESDTATQQATQAY